MLTKLNNIKPGDILNEHVYLDQLLILKRGMSLSPIFIKKLNDLGIKEVKILHPSSWNEEASALPTSLKEMGKTKIHIEQFFNLLVTIGTEKRYGNLLFEIEDLNFAEMMFISLMEDSRISSLFNEMEEYDTFTWQHSFDVFLLGTLLGKKIGLPNLEQVAAGFLLHDCGKIQIAKSILDKPGKLTYEEFSEMKNHTLYGHQMLTDCGFASEIAGFAVVHHERLNGSGYPKGLHAEELEIAARILMIVDVYSALTLERPYRKAYSAHKALQILLEDDDCYDLGFLLQFIELMNIYPEEAIVRLSNNEEATVVKVIDSIPTLPIVQTEGKKEIIKLTVDRFLTIKRLVKWKKVNSGLLMESYIEALLHGKKRLAYDLFHELTEHMKIEEMYHNVIGRSMKNIGSLWEEGRISFSQEQKATSITIELLEWLSFKTPSSENHHLGTIILAIPCSEQHTLPLEMVAGVLKLHGMNVVKLSLPTTVSELCSFIDGHDPICISFSATMAENIPHLARTCKRLKARYPDLPIIVGGRAVQGKNLRFVDLTAKNILDFVSFLKALNSSKVS
ncbi:HD domain-containing phosphohydrolase [Bacillus sp. FJAT-27445]|uniref:HD domain-containing phosphohydrolase n=1 Tax=Bacillus sp. FJAT-27445 TaxID=1679166 RepID=UPI000744255A|nr:HD domain-containing phosphohydrolase [Bacillus sp. FJAT-27445]